jgi:predicted TIM-barrel enzyme
MEDHESLQTSAVVSKLTDAVQDEVHDLLADGVVATGVVVGSILLTRDDLLRMVQLTISSSADLITHSRLKVDKDATRNVLAGTSLREEGVEGVITTTDGLVGRHLTIRLDAVLEAVQLPATITSLHTSLTKMN